MFIGSASIAPKTEIAAPKATVVAKANPAVQPHVESSYTPSKSAPVNLTGGANQVQQTGGPPPSNPAGNVPQAWTNTCGANTIMAMEASVDEDRAAQLSGLTGDDRAQQEMAVMNSNPAVAGFQPTSDGSRGWGYDRMQEQVANRFGGVDETLSYRTIPDQGTAADTLVTALSDGRPVALGMDGHWMAATDIRGTGDNQEVLIQDSWTGQSAWVPVSQIRNGEDWVTTNFGSEIPKSSAILSTVVPSTDHLDPNSTFRQEEQNPDGARGWVEDRMSGWASLRRTLPDVPTPTAPSTSEDPLPVPRWFNHPIAV